MLPCPNRQPTELDKTFVNSFVALPVERQLRRPIAGVNLGLNAVRRTTVPEAAVYKDGDFGANKDKVGRNARSGGDPLTKPIP